MEVEHIGVRHSKIVKYCCQFEEGKDEKRIILVTGICFLFAGNTRYSLWRSSGAADNVWYHIQYDKEVKPQMVEAYSETAYTEGVRFADLVENQKNADYKLGIFCKLPIKHKCITAQPLLEHISIEKYLDKVELVVVGGESDYNARPLDYSWVLDIREQCIRKNVSFEFRQCGTHFIKDGKLYKLQTKDLCSQAKKANSDCSAVE